MDAFPQIDGQKFKSYWSRPGGKLGTFLIVAALCAAGFWAAPILTTIVWNTINFGIACGVGAFLLFLVTNKKIRMLVTYAYEILIRSTFGQLLEMDPWVLADDDIQEMIKTREKVNDQATLVDGQKEALDAKIQEHKKSIAKCADRIKTLQSQGVPKGYEGQLENDSLQIDRLKDAISRLAPIRDNLAKTGDFLNHVYTDSGYKIQNAKNELEVEKDTYNASTVGAKALNTALKLFKGDPEKQMLRDQSILFIKNKIANNVASMKKAITGCSDYMRSIDLDNATAAQAGLRMMQDYDENTDTRVDIGETKPEPKIARKVGELDTTNYEKLLD